MTGCLAQRYQQEIIDEIPEVDAVLGTASYDKIAEAIDEGTGRSYRDVCWKILTDFHRCPAAKRLVTTGGHYAYLKIAEGL